MLEDERVSNHYLFIVTLFILKLGNICLYWSDYRLEVAVIEFSCEPFLFASLDVYCVRQGFKL